MHFLSSFGAHAFRAPEYFSNSWTWLKASSQSASTSIIQKSQEIFQTFKSSHFGKPYYKRYIAPLTRTDYKLVSSATIGALFIRIIVPFKYGPGAIPLSYGAGIALIGGTGAFVKSRLERYFNKAARGHVDQIQQVLAQQFTSDIENFKDVQTHLGPLKQFEFEHLKEDVGNLEKQLADFKKSWTKQRDKDPDRQALQTEINADIGALNAHFFKKKEKFQRLEESNPQKQELLAAVESFVKLFQIINDEIPHLGNSKENLELLVQQLAELRKLNVNEPKEIVSLYNNTFKLIALTSAQRQFKAYLINLKQKLVPLT